MHSDVKDVNQEIGKLYAAVEELRTLQSAGMIHTDYLLTDIQFSQIMASIAELPISDPAKTFQYHRSLQDTSSHNSHQSLSTRFWASLKLLKFFSTENSEILIIKANFQSRFSLRNFCVDVIEQLNSSHTPVLFALKVDQGSWRTRHLSRYRG